MSDFELSRVFLAIILLITGAHSLGFLFEKIRLPRVGGELLGGLLLGPSCLGLFWPGTQNFLFNSFPAQPKLLATLYWFGLILLMFVAGFRLETKILHKEWKMILTLLIGTALLPFIGGWLAIDYLDLFLAHFGDKATEISFILILAIASAVTSIPVISKIFLDLGIIKTPFAAIVLATATLKDVLLWVGLTIATGLASGHMNTPAEMILVVLKTITFLGVGLLIGPYLLKLDNRLMINLILKSSRSGYALLWCFIMVFFASLLHINVVFGALLAGIAFSSLPEHRFGPAKDAITDVARAFFIPLYFALVGLKINLPESFDAPLFLGFLGLSTLLLASSGWLAAKTRGCSAAEATNYAIAMNTRGGPGIVLASVAYEAGIIDSALFVALVLTSLATSIFTGFWFRRKNILRNLQSTQTEKVA